jgi:hypothetical protein
LVKNINVYGLNESVKASKYPMAVDTEQCTDEITDRTLSLATCERGTGHDNFLKGVIVQFDLTFSIKAWVEAERYHWFDFVSSQSTMHRISVLDIDKQCNEYVTENTKREVQRLKDVYNADKTPENYLNLLYNVPVGFRLTARMTTNYQQLKTIYGQRKAHRLPEWREVCKWIETLPHSEFIVGGLKDD